MQPRRDSRVHLRERRAGPRGAATRRDMPRSLVLGLPPEFRHRWRRGEEAIGEVPCVAAAHRHRRAVEHRLHRDPQCPNARQEVECAAQLRPDRHHGGVGDRAVAQREHGGGIIVRMQSRHPRPVSVTQVQGQLAPIAPLRLARRDSGCVDCALPDAREAVGDDPTLGPQLCLIRQVLELAPAAAVRHVVLAAWDGAVRRRSLDAGDGAAREPLRAAQRDVHQVARRGPWHEDHHAARATDPVTAGADALDLHTARCRRRHRSASRRATRSHSLSGVAAGAAGADAVA